MYAYKYVSKYVYICKYMYACMYVSMPLYEFILHRTIVYSYRVYACMYVYMYACVNLLGSQLSDGYLLSTGLLPADYSASAE